jgi:hypothetical protein
MDEEDNFEDDEEIQDADYEEINEENKKEIEEDVSDISEPEKQEEKTEETKTESPETAKKETKKLLIVLAIVIGIFIAFFVTGYFLKHDSTKVTTIDDLHRLNMEGKESDVNYMYNGFSFVFVNGLWYTQVQVNDTLLDLPLHYGPKELKNISLTGSINESFMRKGIFITFNPTEDEQKYVALAASELSLSMAKGFGIKPIAACDRNETDIEEKKEEVAKACTGIQVITCESGKPAIYLKQEEPAGIKMKGNCIIVQGAGMNLTKSVDRLLYEWYQVMKVKVSKN